jgi:hypothetical protein
MSEIVEKYVAIYGEQRRQLITDSVAFVISREYWQQKKWNWDHYFQDLMESVNDL